MGLIDKALGPTIYTIIRVQIRIQEQKLWEASYNRKSLTEENHQNPKVLLQFLH